jgi:hypothetical protein
LGLITHYILVIANETQDQRSGELHAIKQRHLDIRTGRGSLPRMVRLFVPQGETAFLECAIEKGGEYTEG